MSSSTKNQSFPQSFYNFNLCASLSKVKGIKLAAWIIHEWMGNEKTRAKLSLTQPKEPPSSPQLSRIPRFGRRPSAITENDSPKVNLNSSLNVSFSGSPVRPRRPSAVSDSDTSKVNLNASLNNSFSSGLPVFSRRPSAQIESDIPKINLNNSFSSGRSSVSTSPRPSRSNSQANIHVSSQQPSNDSPNLGSPSLANSTSKRKLSVSDLNYSGDGRKSAGIRRRPSATDAGYVSVSGTSLVSSPSASHAESPGYSSPRRRPSVSLDADAAKREGVISFTPQIKTSPVTDPGRVQVFVRIRPPNEDEIARGDHSAVSIEDPELTQLKLLDGKNDRLYQFDGILPDNTNNKEVFKVVGQPLVHSALSGFNGILMCYGQTGTDREDPFSFLEDSDVEEVAIEHSEKVITYFENEIGPGVPKSSIEQALTLQEFQAKRTKSRHSKTYTLMSHDGMTVRVVYKCFRIINKDRKHRYTVTCSYLQIYQEKIYDLLNATRTVDLSLREHPKKGVYVENLTEYVVHSPREVLNLMKIGKRRLVFAETQMNRLSSRSHAICQLRILKERTNHSSDTGRNETPLYGLKTPEPDLLNGSWQNSDFNIDVDFGDDDMFGPNMNSSMDVGAEEDEDDSLDQLTDLDDSVTSVRGKIHICDLAGSERIKRTKASGERLQEAQHINSSLLELGNVIQALAEGNRGHVPFRNSTLTRLLQDGLSGNCKTSLVVCVAPTLKDVHETKCSLNFGSRAMKVQVTAHVNYDVDYKKLAECLAAKLEALEAEWNVQKGEYEKFIQSLKSEISSRRGILSPVKSPQKLFEESSGADKQQVQSLLVLELMTLQLFYNLQGKRHLIGSAETEHARITIISDDNQDILLQSMESLLELLNDYQRGRVTKDFSMSSTGSSSITSPDCIEHNITDGLDVAPTLEPVARFLEHAQQIQMQYQSNSNVTEKTTMERFKRVLSQLARLKESVGCSALSLIKQTVEVETETSAFDAGSITSIQDFVSKVNSQKDFIIKKNAMENVGMLENSLYYILMDKALLSCIALLGSQVDEFSEVWNQITLSRAQDTDEERKRILEELTVERKEKDKIAGELCSARQEKAMSDEKLTDLELELKTVRELKASVESKLCALEGKNVKLEEQIKTIKKDKANIEKKIADLDQRKAQLEHSLKSSENNNAKKERIIVDLKNEKAALDSIVSTLKDELSILEKEKSRDYEEKRTLEEELEDVKDRNIILETEWSCCKEENGLLERELTALEEDKVMLEEEIGKYREDVQMMEEALTILEKEADDYKTNIVSLKSKEDKLINMIKLEKDKFNKELTAIKQEMSTLRVEKRRFQRDISISKADKSNTERAYNALKGQKDALQGDLSAMRQEEKKLQRELAALRNDKTKLEREVATLKTENLRLKNDLSQADKLKVEIKSLQKNEEKLTANFKQEKDKLNEELTSLREKYGRIEHEFNKLQMEKDKLAMQLKRYEAGSSASLDSGKADSVQRKSSTSSSRSSRSPDKRFRGPSPSTKTAKTGKRPISLGQVTEVESKVLDLQRRLAFFMAEKEDIQKELIVTREKNTKVNEELRTLEQDTSHIQRLLNALTKEKTELENRMSECTEARTLLENERDQLRKAVKTSQEINTKLQARVDEVLEKNRTIEVDKTTLEASMKKLRSETAVLVTENRHIRGEFDRMEKDLKLGRENVTKISSDYDKIKAKLEESQDNERKLGDRVLDLESENASVSHQLLNCKKEEEELLGELGNLTSKFDHLERKVEEVLIERSAFVMDSAKEEIMKQTKGLREENSMLEHKYQNLRLQMEKLSADAEDLKEERKEIEKLVVDEVKKEGDSEKDEDRSLVDHVKEMMYRIESLNDDKQNLLARANSLEIKLNETYKENGGLKDQMNDRKIRLEQEKEKYQEHLKELYKQVEGLITEKKALQAEIDFLRQQNSEVRAEIAIILEENDKLEADLEELEGEYEKQEQDLEQSKEETKNLLRQVCSAETKNLQLRTAQSTMQDDAEILKEKYDLIDKQNRILRSKNETSEIERVTLQDRLLVAELEMARLKAEVEALSSQKRELESTLENVNMERANLRSELQSLARALSPLKKEVNAAIRKQTDLQNEEASPDGESSPVGDDSGFDMHVELQKVEEDSISFNAERVELEEERQHLEKKLQITGLVRQELRQKLHAIIRDLTDHDQGSEKSGGSSARDSINGDVFKEVGELANKLDELKEEESLLKEELGDIEGATARFSIELDTVTSELKSSQENLSLALIERLQLSQRVLQVGKEIKNLEEGDGHVTGVKIMEKEVKILRDAIKQFEKSGQGMLSELKMLSNQLDMAESNLNNIGHFKTVIERNLREYKERNIALETQLKFLHADLEEMEKRCPEKTLNRTKLLMETITLQDQHTHIEDDLNKCNEENSQLKEEANELSERCEELEEEKDITKEAQSHLEESLESQRRKIAQLQKDKETLLYEKNKLKTKLSLFKDDKKRLLDDFHRLNKSLGAYARYNNELEKKLDTFKDDLNELEQKASVVKAEKSKSKRNGTSEVKSELLCHHCRKKVNKKFSGVSKNTQILGDELLDCIGDSLSLETAILTFMDEKSKLQQELMVIDADRQSLENILNVLNDGTAYGLSSSQLSMDDWGRGSTPFMWPSSRLSTRSKSMTSHSGDSFVGEAPEEPPSTPMRCHTALGICSSSSSLSPDHLSGESMESLDNSELSTSTPRKVTSPNGIRKHNTDSSSTDQEVVDLAVMDENYNPLNDFEPVPEGQLLDAEGHDRNGKSKNLSGFLKKFRSNKRKRAAKGTNTL